MILKTLQSNKQILTLQQGLFIFEKKKKIAFFSTEKQKTTSQSY